MKTLDKKTTMTLSREVDEEDADVNTQRMEDMIGEIFRLRETNRKLLAFIVNLRDFAFDGRANDEHILAELIGDHCKKLIKLAERSAGDAERSVPTDAEGSA